MSAKKSAKLSRVVKKTIELDHSQTLQPIWTVSPLYMPLVAIVSRVK